MQINKDLELNPDISHKIITEIDYLIAGLETEINSGKCKSNTCNA